MSKEKSEDEFLTSKAICSWSQNAKYRLYVPDLAKLIAAEVVGNYDPKEREEDYQAIADSIGMANHIPKRLMIEVRDESGNRMFTNSKQKCHFYLLDEKDMKTSKTLEWYGAIIYCRTPKKKDVTSGLQGLGCAIDAINRWLDYEVMHLSKPMMTGGFYLRAADLKRMLLETPIPDKEIKEFTHGD